MNKAAVPAERGALALASTERSAGHGDRSTASPGKRLQSFSPAMDTWRIEENSSMEVERHQQRLREGRHFSKVLRFARLFR